MNYYDIGKGTVLGFNIWGRILTNSLGIFHETHDKRQLPKHYERLKSPKYYERSRVGLNVVGGLSLHCVCTCLSNPYVISAIDL